MEFQSRCPTCGAPLSIQPGIDVVSCIFCSSRFKVDLSGVEPGYEKLPPATLAGPVEAPEIKIENGVPQPETMERFNEPEVIFPNSTGRTTAPQSRAFELSRLFGGRLWMIIALIVTAFFCISCLCTYAVVRALLNIGG